GRSAGNLRAGFGTPRRRRPGAPARLAVHGGLPPGPAAEATTSRAPQARPPRRRAARQTGRRSRALRLAGPSGRGPPAARPAGAAAGRPARGDPPARLRGEEVPRDRRDARLPIEHGPGTDARGVEAPAAAVGGISCLRIRPTT